MGGLFVVFRPWVQPQRSQLLVAMIHSQLQLLLMSTLSKVMKMYQNISNTWFLIVFVNCSMIFFHVWVQPDVNLWCFCFGGSLESTAQLSSFSLRRNPYSRALGSQALGWWLQCRDHDAFGKPLIAIFTNCTRRLGWESHACMNDDYEYDDDDEYE